ncbi:DUF3253 domain-containing protein [Fulvimarina endophytica]|uniref:DUF3253 domain-containing protein n=1 Tax=Fulvimarina endophytica TaxID=2293836 RepID=A0A371X7A0_9HYPH|nr:DUF3253 domain-containing protein [Fulvimarina endophytica]RFC65119.1 DUF3253 domain-containing protein [Fulvimarina endophytica]
MSATELRIDSDEIARTILTLCAERGPDKTVCPSEVARAIAGSDEKRWRRLMPTIRHQSIRLADKARIVIRRKGRVVDPHAFKGIYRLAIPAPDA